jgi:hypothetical protein
VSEWRVKQGFQAFCFPIVSHEFPENGGILVGLFSPGYPLPVV